MSAGESGHWMIGVDGRLLEPNEFWLIMVTGRGDGGAKLADELFEMLLWMVMLGVFVDDRSLVPESERVESPAGSFPRNGCSALLVEILLFLSARPSSVPSTEVRAVSYVAIELRLLPVEVT